jgi:serine/threonine-protein kinase
MTGNGDPRTSRQHDTPAGTAHGPTPSEPEEPNQAAITAEVGGLRPPGVTAELPLQADGIAGFAVDGPEPPAVGRRYRVESLHRAGGLGRVWVAKDNAIGRVVALKDLRPDRSADPRLRVRFVEEARITGKLEHPCIVPLYDLIDGPVGPCYTMRFVAGRTLAEAARSYHDKRAAGQADPLALTGLLDAFVAVCQAVAYAHSRGVLHRDLKGQNVVLGEYGEVFVLDWGLAKLSGDPMTVVGPAVVTPVPDGSREDTVTGAVLGTPAFMAPEMVEGRPASRASDVYALGGLLYVILTGQPPYDGPTMQSVLEQLQAGPPPPPRAVVPSCPPALDAICRTAMARDPAERYASAEALAADVRRWLADEPIRVYLERWSARLARWARRHRSAVFGATAVLLTAVVGLAASTALVWQEQRRTAAAKENAEREWARAEQNLGRANDLALAFMDVSDTQLLMVRQDKSARKAMAAACLGALRESLMRRPYEPNLRLQTARACRYSANLHRLLNETSEAEPLYSEAVRILDGLARDIPDSFNVRDQLSGTLRDRARLLNRLGRFDEAIATGQHSVDLAEGLLVVSPDRLDYRRSLVSSLNDLAGYEFTRGQLSVSEDLARRAAKLLHEFLDQPAAKPQPDDRMLMVLILDRLATILRERERFAESIAVSTDALGQLRLLPPNDNNALHYLGRLAVDRAKIFVTMPDRLPDAERELRDAIRTWDDLQKRVSPLPMYREWQASAYETLGGVIIKLGRTDDAAKELATAQATFETLIAETPEMPVYCALLGRTCLKFGRLEASRQNPARARELFAKARDGFRVAVQRSGKEKDRRGLQDAEDELRKLAAQGDQKLPQP